MFIELNTASTFSAFDDAFHWLLDAIQHPGIYPAEGNKLLNACSGIRCIVTHCRRLTKAQGPHSGIDD
jgi:hypothetical protein